MRNPKFTAQLEEMAALHDRKNADYATDANPLSNFEEASQVAAGFSGVDAVFATLIGVKLARLRELTSAGKTPNNESIADTRTDLAMYATLWASYYRVPEVRTDVRESGTFVTNERGSWSYDEKRAAPIRCHCGRDVHNGQQCADGCIMDRHPHEHR